VATGRLDPDRTVADMARNGRIEQMFSTPLFSYVLDAAAAPNAELRGLILERERRLPSAAKSNQGGWQSAPDFFHWGGTAVATLEYYLSHALNIATLRVPVPAALAIEFELYGWAAVNRRGHYNSVHIHPQATWSGVYYVDAGDEAADATGAVLEFAHPVTAAAMTFFPGILPAARIVRPQSGMILLFPAYLQHSVRKYDGERPRICVAFNAHLRSTGS
jgi:uncharacterized protein (TIGR02466 family)